MTVIYQNYLLQSLIIAEALSKVYRLMLVKNCNVSLSFNYIGMVWLVKETYSKFDLALSF